MYRKKCTVCIMLIFIKVLDRAFKIPASKNLNVISAVSGENVHCGTEDNKLRNILFLLHVDLCAKFQRAVAFRG